MRKIITSPFLLLPLVVILGVLTVGLRVADVYDLASSGKMSFKEAQAETAQTTHAAQTAHEEPSRTERVAESNAKPDLDIPAPSADASQAEIDVLKQLSDRRKQLDKRASDMDSREAMIKVMEQRVDQKIKELETLRVQLQSMVDQVAGAQQTQTENLVKIYETMKPDEAAKIFETLDLPVLLGVIQKMKPAKTALVMARMVPEKAKEITVALTKQDQLPQLK